MRLITKLFLDGVWGYIIFVPALSFIVGWLPQFIPFIGTPWDWDDYMRYWITALPIELVIGAIYGRSLNKWRKKWGYE